MLCLLCYVSICGGILRHGSSNAPEANENTSPGDRITNEMIELHNIVATLSAKVTSLEHNHAQMEKENLDLKTLVKHSRPT